MTLDENGKRIPIEIRSAMPRLKNESLAGWSPDSPPPPGYGIIYCIVHYHMEEPIGMYVGLTKRAAYARWNEHLIKGISSLIIGPRANDTKARKSRNNEKPYQYFSGSDSGLYGAIAISTGRRIINNFNRNFSFHVVGLYSLYSLDMVEASMIDKIGLQNTIRNPKGYRNIRYIESYNRQTGSHALPGPAFKGLSSYKVDHKDEPIIGAGGDFVVQVLSLEAFLNFERGNFSSINKILQEPFSTKEQLVDIMARYFYEKPSGHGLAYPSNVKKAKTKNDKIFELKKSISGILNIKVALGKSLYLAFQGKPYLSYTQLLIGIKVAFGTGSGKGVGGRASEASMRAGTVSSQDSERIVAGKGKDNIFESPNSAPKKFFDAIEEFLDKEKMKIPNVEKVMEKLVEMNERLAILIANNIGASSPQAMNKNQQEINSLIRNIQITLSKNKLSTKLVASIYSDGG
jgi:hypothetical protein